MTRAFTQLRLFFYSLRWFLLVMVPLACVDPEDILLRGTVDIIVVDGTLTNLAEEQIIRLNRSKSDPLTGRFGSRPITKAIVEVVVDSAQIVPCHETVDGSYQLPSDFKGQIGHAYQLRFTLSDGTQYASNQQIIQAVPPINNVTSQFNPKSIFPALGGYYTAGHDLFIDVNDPADARNYYRWDWKLYEKQEWCKTCYKGVYAIYGDITTQLMEAPPPGGNFYLYISGNTKLLEDCYYELTPPPYSLRNPVPEYTYDYNCRGQCWEIIYSHDFNLFSDQYSNGGVILNKEVAQIPFYDHNPGLVDVRQSSLTPDAYRYFQLFQQQTQNTGGLADTPPSALAGNVHNVANDREAVVGYFTASAVASFRYWLDRKDAYGVSLGGSGPNGYSGLPGEELFYALHLRRPMPEPSFPEAPQLQLLNAPPRPPTAICSPSDTKTPVKPEGWRD
ncbi:DUF4249 domain-containing protein [Spirosoma pollinicola]|uniref:DUF4249 domain-containing protein n=1 Tax=Spirosoma pollinicola TaxID=2057025 RepID=A0A2K8Z139_9BACT|nr:DUF4249 domain-containing protein [Spirosoma pollinicola]AUD03602.1 DUF4249 domain-containing protein [Spirosoma pollinicola]